MVTVLITLAAAAFGNLGFPPAWRQLAPALRSFPVSTLGVICFALVGLEIGPVMGDEVREPRKTFPRSILLGGSLCVVAYVGSTVSLASAVSPSDMAVVQGLMRRSIK